MTERTTFVKRFRLDPTRHLIGLYSLILGLLFFLYQTRKLFFPEKAEAEMAELPFGRFDWGYVWSDTLVAGPTLLIGGILMLSGGLRVQRLGRLLAFTGFAINLYAMIFLWIGFAAVGEPITGGVLWFNVTLILLGILSMISIATKITKGADV